jgi:hypothetical protein
MFARQKLETKTRMVSSVQSVPRCYKHDSWNNDLVEGQSPAGKNMSTEAEDIVGIRH